MQHIGRRGQLMWSPTHGAFQTRIYRLQSRLPYWMGCANLRNEGFRRVQLMDTSAPPPPWFFALILSYDDGASIWAQDDDCRRALQGTVVWSCTPLNPSKLSLWRVNPLKGLGRRVEPFWMERRAICSYQFNQNNLFQWTGSKTYFMVLSRHHMESAVAALSKHFNKTI